MDDEYVGVEDQDLEYELDQNGITKEIFHNSFSQLIFKYFQLNNFNSEQYFIKKIYKCKINIYILFYCLDVLEYAKQIGIDIKNEPHLLWIAEEGLVANLPKDWFLLYVEHFNFSNS